MFEFWRRFDYTARDKMIYAQVSFSTTIINAFKADFFLEMRKISSTELNSDDQ